MINTNKNHKHIYDAHGKQLCCTEESKNDAQTNTGQSTDNVCCSTDEKVNQMCIRDRALMNIFGVSANLMSLGAIDFGLIVDGAVIIVEATLHHLGLRKSTQRLTQQEMDNEVFASASKIRSSAAFGEIIILIVYIPILTSVSYTHLDVYKRQLQNT